MGGEKSLGFFSQPIVLQHSAECEGSRSVVKFVVYVSGSGAGGSKAERYFIGQGTIQKKCEKEVCRTKIPILLIYIWDRGAG